jgi:hypothetical protein
MREMHRSRCGGGGQGIARPTSQCGCSFCETAPVTLRLLRLLLQTAVVASAFQATCCNYCTDEDVENFDVLFVRVCPPVLSDFTGL